MFIRHSKSCANYVRAVGEEYVTLSQALRDPQLSSVGTEMARNYGPHLRKRLLSIGIDVAGAILLASPLQRAQQTAALLFGRSPVTAPHITENGAIPENTPKRKSYRKPAIDAFFRYIHRAYPHTSDFIVVSHGSFLKTQVWPALTGRPWVGTFHNLDAFVVTGDLEADEGMRVRSARVLRNPHAAILTASDRCSTLPVMVRRKIVSHTRMRKGKGKRGVTAKVRQH